jgi:hypothetical protein
MKKGLKLEYADCDGEEADGELMVLTEGGDRLLFLREGVEARLPVALG